MARIVSADPVDVGQHHRAPVLDRLLEEAARGAEAGVGEDRVDAAEALERGRGHRLDLVPLGDVAAHRQRPLLAAELAGELLERLQPPRRQHQPVAAGRRPRGRGADAAAGAGDQQDRIVAVAIARDSAMRHTRSRDDPRTRALR